MPYAAPADLAVGHVHLKVTDLERSVDFYTSVLGLSVQQRGARVAFLAAGGYHHHVALNTWQSADGPRPDPRAPGLFHAAFRYPDRPALAAAVAQVIAAQVPILGASDHGVSEAVYLEDPDGNGIELYRDRARTAWPRDAQGGLAMTTRALDLADLLAAAGEPAER